MAALPQEVLVLLRDIAVNTVVGVSLAGIVYGANLILFGIWIVAVFVKEKVEASMIVRVFMFSMIILNTLDQIFSYAYMIDGYAANFGNLLYMAPWQILVARQVFQILEVVAVQLFMTYRLYVVYSRRWYVTIVPIGLSIAALINFLYQDAVLAQHNGDLNVLTLNANLTTSALACIFSNDLIITLAICGRLWSSGRTHNLGKVHQQRYFRLITILVESAAIISAIIIFEFAAWLKHSNTHLLANFLSGQLYGFSAYAIILQAVRLRYGNTTRHGETAHKATGITSELPRHHNRAQQSGGRSAFTMVAHINRNTHDFEKDEMEMPSTTTYGGGSDSPHDGGVFMTTQTFTTRSPQETSRAPHYS